MTLGDQEPIRPRGRFSRLLPRGMAGALLISLLLSVAAMLLFRNVFFLFLVLPLAPLGQLWRQFKSALNRSSGERTE